MANNVAAGDMTKRNWIYVGLLAFLIVGGLVDILIWPMGAATLLTWSNAVQAFGLMVFVYSWEAADATALGQRQSSPARLLTILFPLAGHAVYLYQTRNWKRATALLVLYWFGVLIASIVAALAVVLFLDIVDPIRCSADGCR